MVQFFQSLIRLAFFVIDRVNSPKSELKSIDNDVYLNTSLIDSNNFTQFQQQQQQQNPDFIPCPDLRQISGPYVEFPLPEQCSSSVPPGTRCNIGCQPNYELVGSCSRVCYGNGQWSGYSTQCINRNIRCPPLPNLSGQNSGPRRRKRQTVPATLDDPLGCLPFAGSRCQLRCPQGTFPTANLRISCLETGQWDSRE